MMLAKQGHLLRRKIGRWLGKFTLVSIVLTICCYIYGTKIEPNWIEIVPVQLAIPHLDRAFDNFKLVQISDLHATRFMPQQRLTRIINLVNQQHPDAIAITGDFITRRSHVDEEQLKLQLERLQSKSGITVAVLGNHDHWHNKLAVVKQVLSDSRIVNLDNQVYLVERGSHQLAFAGIDDPYWGKADLSKTLAQLPDGVPAIFLVHEPDYIETSAETHRFALQLSGHSHGGQVKIPFFHPLVLPHGAKKYFIGLDKVQDTFTYTNRGLGMTNLPIRFGSRPEITVFTLHSAA